MTRKDLIVVAVLINAGVLVVLFATGLKTENDDKQMVSKGELSEKVVTIEAPGRETLSLPDPEAVAMESKNLVAKPEFADDIKALDEIEVTPGQEFIEVTVKKGDVLEKIAGEMSTSVKEIMRWNNLKTTKLKIGQTLRIPTVKKKSSPSDSSEYYVVKNGDNPWTIAVKNRIKVEELLRLNNLDEEKARRLKPGDRLRIK